VSGGGVTQRFVIPVHPAHIGFRLEINFHSDRADGHRVVEEIGAPCGVWKFRCYLPISRFSRLEFWHNRNLF